jgi:ribosomal protein S18 acetylase RimI-like enzyme
MSGFFLMTLSIFLFVTRSFCSFGANAAQQSIKTSITNHKKIPFTIRRANKEDIPGINQINLDNLPENYSHYFYLNHLEKWPELSIVAETTSNEMIGYALGRLEGNPNPIGHVASVAVNKRFRGCGVAQSLMNSLHVSFVNDYNVDSVSLYCRVSVKYDYMIM